MRDMPSLRTFLTSVVACYTKVVVITNTELEIKILDKGIPFRLKQTLDITSLRTAVRYITVGRIADEVIGHEDDPDQTIYLVVEI